jgi:hypothetical protein
MGIIQALLHSSIPSFALARLFSGMEKMPSNVANYSDLESLELIGIMLLFLSTPDCDDKDSVRCTHSPGSLISEPEFDVKTKANG